VHIAHFPYSLIVISCDALRFAGYEPYDTPYYPRNVAIAVVVCFFALISFILIVNLIGFVIGTASRPRAVVQQRTAQI